MDADPLSAADAAYREARAALGQYQLRDTRRHLDEAKRLLDTARGPNADHEALALRIQLTESWLICDEFGLAAAIDRVAEVGVRAEYAGREDLRALAHIQAGVLLARAGHFADALAHLRPAVGFSHALPVDDRVRLLLNKGTISSQLGLLDEAADDLAEAARLAVGLPEYAFMALHNLGFVDYLRGNLPAALRAMVAADAMDTPVDRAVARLDRARVLMEVGLVDDAAELLITTVASLREANMMDELSDALLDQARCALIRGHGSEAIAIADEVLALTTTRDDADRRLAASAVRIEALVLDGRSDRVAVDDASRLVSAAEAAGMDRVADRAAALGVLATTRLGVGTIPAEVPVRLRRLRRSPHLSTRLLAIRAELGLNPEPARHTRLVRRAMRELATAKEGMASLDLRTALTIHSVPIIVEDLRRAVVMDDAWSVLNATERWRGALRTLPSVMPPEDPRAAELWSLLRRAREELRAPSAAGDRRLHAETVQLERQLRERSWAGRGVAPNGGARRFRRSDARGHIILSYFWLDDQLHLVEVAPHRAAALHRLGERHQIVELVQLASADASALAHAPRSPLATGIASSLQGSLARLDEMLLPDGLGSAPVVIVPSGALARLPWGMLPRLRSRGVALSPSLAQWVVGATELANEPQVGVANGPDLALAASEARLVRQQWGSSSRVEGRAEHVKEALTRYDVVHIAAHGMHRADNPLFSSLRLHGGDLFAHELEHLTPRASLVVLSACGVGRARLRPGDEALGLTASLLALGVGAVCAPLTDVPDALARRTMAGLHERLSAGMAGPEALVDAADSLLARSFTWFGAPWRVHPNS